MNEFKIGDVVYLNSEDRVEMTIVWIDEDVTCAVSTQEMTKVTRKSNRTRLLTGTDSSELPVFNAHGLHQERKIVTSLSFTHFTHK